MLTFKDYLTELKKPEEIGKFQKDVAGIKQVDSRSKSWEKTLPEYMIKYGFKKFGGGKYASVFGSTKYPFIIKVFMKDAAFLQWMKWAIKNQSNPYTPKMRGGVIKLSDVFFALRMEKLEKVTSENWNMFSRNMTLFQQNPSMVKDANLRAALTFCFKNEKLLDLHSDNVMQRSNGQVVIIDPFYNWYKPESGYTIDPNDFDYKSLLK